MNDQCDNRPKAAIRQRLHHFRHTDLCTMQILPKMKYNKRANNIKNYLKTVPKFTKPKDP